jgi:hypothetical protein
MVLGWASALFPVLFSLIAIIGMVSALRSFTAFDSTKTAWLLLLIGFTLDFLGEFMYGFLERVMHVDVEKVYPTIADAFWLAGYIPFFIAMFILINGYKRTGLPMGNWKKYLAGGLFFVVIASGLIYLLLIPMIKDTETNLLAKIVNVYYPVADMVLIVPAVALTLIVSSFGQSRLSLPWKFLSVSFMAMGLADILYSYLSWIEQYGSGNYIDLLWNASYLLAALAGSYQKELKESLSKV